MENVEGAKKVGLFSVTEVTDEARKRSHFSCQICRKDVSILTHGAHEVLRRFQGSKFIPPNQRLRLETPGWRVLHYEGSLMAVDEIERQRDCILGAHW